MSDKYEFTLNSPLTNEDWDKITDTEFEKTDRITFLTPSGKTVEFAKVSEEFEWCHDCKEYDQKAHCCPRWTKVIRKTVEELKQERPHGKWIDEGFYADGHSAHAYRCSECGEHYIGYEDEFWFCPWCGADMRGEEE